MTGLPASIEAYLEESGFSSTEILVLKRLLEGDAMTLRELAARTGKSTGVLDQATKKLLGKGILTKEQINDGLKYTLGSLGAITNWVQKDMNEKKDNLHRKQQNFEMYIASLALDRNRPDMEYFDGDEGIKKAYLKILERGKEMLQYLPVAYKEEEDPLRDFRVEYFRERHKKKIFLRILAHDTVLGKRFQSRDVFEYRKTILVPEDRCPVPFEQIISGDTVACFNHEEKKVCFIRFKEYAESERKFFEAIWQNPTQIPTLEDKTEEEMKEAQAISLRTKTLSGLREFFLSRKSIATFFLFACLSAGITYGLYRHNLNLNTQRIKEQIQSIAATGAFQFNAADLEALQVESDWQKPEWNKVVNQLIGIRESNANVLYVYIFRRNKNDPNRIDFVADSHSLNPYANVDDDPTNDVNVGVDKGGSLLLQWPGQEYVDAPEEIFGAFTKPTSSEDFYTDIWGTTISGYAPIKDAENETVAVLAVDIEAAKLDEFNKQSFTPFVCFVILFLCFVFVRFSAFNRSLFEETIALLRNKRAFILFSVIACLALLLTGGMYLYTFSLMKDEIGNRLMSIAATAALDIDPNDINQIRFARDMQTDAYQRIFKKLNEIKLQNSKIKWAYVMRPTDTETMFEYVVDADSNYYPMNDVEPVWPGYQYDISMAPINFQKYALVKPIADDDFSTDKWGTFLSGSAPIFNNSGQAIAILGVDMEVADIKETINNKFKPAVWFFTIILVVSGLFIGLNVSRR